MSNSDDITQPLGPEHSLVQKLFYEYLLSKFMPEFYEAANRLGISDEALREAINDSSGSSLGDAFAHFCRHVIAVRVMERSRDVT